MTRSLAVWGILGKEMWISPRIRPGLGMIWGSWGRDFPNCNFAGMDSPPAMFQTFSGSRKSSSNPYTVADGYIYQKADAI